MGSTASPTTKQGLIDPTQYDVRPKPQIRPEPQYDFTKADQRFDLVSVTRAVNGVVWARVLDRKTGDERKVRAFDGIDSFIVTEIDADDRTATIVDGSMRPVILSARAETKK